MESGEDEINSLRVKKSTCGYEADNEAKNSPLNKRRRTKSYNLEEQEQAEPNSPEWVDVRTRFKPLSKLPAAR